MLFIGEIIGKISIILDSLDDAYCAGTGAQAGRKMRYFTIWSRQMCANP